ncbi:serpin family protein [Streptomyces sp. NPDC054861]
MGGRDPGAYAEAVRALAERWLPRFGDQDFVCSPAGLWLALGAVASGARADTARELGELLGVDAGEAAGAVTRAGRWLGRTGGLAVATGLWSAVPLLDGFRRGLPDVGFGTLAGAGAGAGAGPEAGAGAGAGGAQGVIDAWVAEATGGRIGRLPLALDGSEDLVLANALALKVSWRHAFPVEATRDEPFTDRHGDTTSVPTMHQRIPSSWAWRVGGTTVVELPCEGPAGTGRAEGTEKAEESEGSAARVRFVLGAAGAEPAGTLAAAWAGDGRREALRADGVALALPRFSLRTRTDVHGRLPAPGITRAIRPGADFSGLSPRPLYLAKAVQEALVEVAEQGVEAAAVTAVAMTRSGAARRKVIEEIAFDRPFGVVVLDASGGTPLFAGWRSSAPRPRTGADGEA